MVRVALIGVMTALVGCRGDAPSRDSSTIATASAWDSSTVTTVSTTATGAMAFEDSVVDWLLPGRSAVTPSGDTLVSMGGGMLDDDYGADQYRKNATRYLRVQRVVGRTSDGKAIWSTRARVPLPAMDSTQWLMFAGMCGIDDKPDHYVFAVAVANDDSVYRDIRGAWRFDRATETLRAIPTANVLCWNQGGDD
jgi:hypothetical protein